MGKITVLCILSSCYGISDGRSKHWTERQQALLRRLAVDIADKINPFVTMELLSPSLMLGFKLQLLSRMKEF
jgi:hypothetical protein